MSKRNDLETLLEHVRCRHEDHGLGVEKAAEDVWRRYRHSDLAGLLALAESGYDTMVAQRRTAPVDDATVARVGAGEPFDSGRMIPPETIRRLEWLDFLEAVEARFEV